MIVCPFASNGQYFGDPTEYYEADVQIHTFATRPPIPATYRAATIMVDYLGAWEAEAIMAFDEAVRIWETALMSDVIITIRAQYLDIPNSGVIGSTTTGYTQKELLTNVIGVVPDTDYPSALANKLAGFDLLPLPNFVDGLVVMDDHTEWYFGLDGSPPSGQLDFVSVAMHEIGHAMGFDTRGVSVDPLIGIGSMAGSGAFTIWDRFICDGNGNFLVDLIEQGVIENPSVELGDLLQSNNLFWCGSNSISIGIHAPDPWNPGTSYIHTSQSFSSTTNGDGLMVPFYAGPVPGIGPMILGMLQDMGWMVNPITGYPDYATISEVRVERINPNPIYPDDYPLLSYHYTTLLYEEDIISVSGGIHDEYPHYNYSQNTETKIQVFSTGGIHDLISNSFDYIYLTELPTLPSLPVGQSWIRNHDGRVKAKALFTAGTLAEGQLRAFRILGIAQKPDAPLINIDLDCQKSTLSFYSREATGYNIYYDTDSGEPYNGTGLPQGASPIYVDGSNSSIAFTKLAADVTYYFNVEAINQFGTSALGEEVSVYVSCDSCGNVSAPFQSCEDDASLIVDYSDVKRSNDLVEVGILKAGFGVTGEVYYESIGQQDIIDFKNVSSSEYSISEGNAFTLAAGNYIIKLKYNLCGTVKDISAPIEIEPLSSCGTHGSNRIVFSNGMQNISAPLGLEIFPNPAEDKITVHAPQIYFQEDLSNTLSIFDVTGKRLIWQILESNESEVNVSILPQGTYFVKLKNDLAELPPQRIVILK